MGEPLINVTSEPTNHLAALAVFMNSHKEEYIKSIHLYDRNGEVLSIEQEYSFNPGNYTCISEPVDPSTATLYQTSFGALTSLSLKQLMASLKKVQEIDGWKCVVEFTSDCPHETTMIELLTPSRNADLHTLPSLAHDLALAEAALIQSSSRNLQISTISVDDQSFNGSVMTSICNSEEGGDSTSKLNPWSAANPSLIMPPSSSADNQIFNDIPGLETPDRTPIPSGLSQGLQCTSLWQTWGSDLELASPRVSPRASHLSSWRCNFSDCTANPGAINFSSSSPTSNPHVEDLSLWSPSLLDLSLNLPDITLDQQSEGLLQLEGPTDDVGQLNLEVADASFSLPDSTLTGVKDGVVDASGIDCFSLECFGLDSSTCCTSFYPEYETMESQERLSSGSLCISTDNLADDHAQMSAGMRQLGFQGFSPLDTFLGHAENSMALSSDSSLSNGLQGMPSFSSTSHADNAYSSTTTGGTAATASSDMYWDVSRAMQSTTPREGRVTRRSAAQGTSTSSNVGNQKHMQRGSSERVTEITIQELSQYFNMPITQASKELKVGLTVLKKKCREFGIPRWPHRKMKSLDSLISNIQDLASEHGGRGSVRVLNAVKELEEQKKLMEEMPGIELAERTKRLRQACFKASYKKRRLLNTTNV